MAEIEMPSKKEYDEHTGKLKENKSAGPDNIVDMLKKREHKTDIESISTYKTDLAK